MPNYEVKTPTLFSTVQEIQEAVDCGYLGYNQHDNNPNDNDFGYNNEINNLPAIFWGGGENDRPNHQPMYVGGEYMFGRLSGRHSLYDRSVMWKDIREKYIPCPCCGRVG